MRETIYHGHRDTPKSGHQREIYLTPRLKAAIEEAAKSPHKLTDPSLRTRSVAYGASRR